MLNNGPQAQQAAQQPAQQVPGAPIVHAFLNAQNLAMLANNHPAFAQQIIQPPAQQVLQPPLVQHRLRRAMRDGIA